MFVNSALGAVGAAGTAHCVCMCVCVCYARVNTGGSCRGGPARRSGAAAMSCRLSGPYVIGSLTNHRHGAAQNATNSRAALLHSAGRRWLCGRRVRSNHGQTIHLQLLEWTAQSSVCRGGSKSARRAAGTVRLAVMPGVTGDG